MILFKFSLRGILLRQFAKIALILAVFLRMGMWQILAVVFSHLMMIKRLASLRVTFELSKPYLIHKFWFLGTRKFDGGCSVQYNTFISDGNDYYKGAVDRDTCARYCYFKGPCVGWTWKDGYCWLKTDASGKENVYLDMPFIKSRLWLSKIV